MFSLTSSTPASPSSSNQHQHLIMHSRRLLLPLFRYPTSTPPPAQAAPPPYYYSTATTFDSNVVMVLSVLLCALICSLALNSVIRCVLRCTGNRFPITPTSPTATAAASPTNNCARFPNTGIKKKALKTFTTLSYSSDLKLGGECVICLSEFTSGDKVRLLPKCNHGFHVRCIDKWLNSHTSCPTCRNCLIETCEKIVGSTDAAISTQPPVSVVLLPPTSPPQQSTPPPQLPSTDQPPQQQQQAPAALQETVVIVDMVALEREGPARNLRVTHS